ncbi:uncharacterized protein LOC122060069 [Macadamia integrifolia]|uniref:uncharacterized protein LOC122060069 n=1 Tax=Macadamia integrifolia TaxID=60698 RepID=UPI001C52945B|nr:uncharacterized protein LOC122060069 [Macadamia integrifolia]
MWSKVLHANIFGLNSLISKLSPCCCNGCGCMLMEPKERNQVLGIQRLLRLDLSVVCGSFFFGLKKISSEMLVYMWTPRENNSLQHQQQAMEEYSGIRLVHLLTTCAESMQRGDVSLAGFLIGDVQIILE